MNLYSVSALGEQWLVVAYTSEEAVETIEQLEGISLDTFFLESVSPVTYISDSARKVVKEVSND